MTHDSIPDEQRNAIAVTKDLIWLSVGIEDVEDLIEDLERGLSQGTTIPVDDYLQEAVQSFKYAQE